MNQMIGNSRNSKMKESIGTCRDCPLRVSDRSGSREAFIVPWQIDHNQYDVNFSGTNNPGHEFNLSK